MEVSVGSHSRPIRHMLVPLPTLAPAPGTHRPECLQLPNQENNSSCPPCPAAGKTERAGALEAAWCPWGRTSWYPWALESLPAKLEVSAANSRLAPNRRSVQPHCVVVVVAPARHQQSPGVWRGAWDVSGLLKGEVKGGGDRSIWKNRICVLNDLCPGTGGRPSSGLNSVIHL